MIRFTINCPDRLSAEVFRKVLEESLTKNFLKELQIFETFVEEEGLLGRDFLTEKADMPIQE